MYVAIVGVGTVSEVEDGTVHVAFPTASSGFAITKDISTDLLPCEASPGDMIYVRKSSDVTEIRCTEFPTEEPETDSSSIEVRIDPHTGEVEYILRNIVIELE